MIGRILSRIKKIRKSRVQKMLVKKGILVLGKNTSISSLEIVLPDIQYPQNSPMPKIKIGDDCIVNGKIVLYSENASVEIGDRVYIGPGTEFFCYDRIVVGDDILFSWGITVIDTNAHSISFELRKKDVLNWKQNKKDWEGIVSKPVIIKSGSWIGFNSIITKGVTINERAIISCGSVVVRDVEADTIVGGNPAQLIKTNKIEEEK